MFEKSSIIKSNHGFSTRTGGVSNGVYSSLNLGMNRGDDEEKVTKNWQIFLEETGIGNIPFVSGKQVHGNYVHIADYSDAAKPYGNSELSMINADGYVTNKVNLPLAIFTADCVPVLMEDEKCGIVGAVHCGWRSAALDIEGEAVRAFESLGGKAENIKAAIGPSIGMCCFEVGSEVPEAFDSLFGRRMSEFYRLKENGKYNIDLQGLVAERFAFLGVPRENIEKVGSCTMCHPDKYYSHRYYNGGVRGSLASVIALS